MGLRKKKTLLDQAEAYGRTAIDQAKVFVNDTALPALQDARDKAAPIVAASAATVAERATEAREYAEAKAAELNGTQPKKRSKIKLLLGIGALGGVTAVVAKKLQAGNSGDGGWQSSYDPAPPPSSGREATPPPPPPTAVTEVPEELTPVDSTSPLGSERRS